MEEIILAVNLLPYPFNKIMLRLTVGEIHGCVAQLKASAVDGR
jgi:hypothetical protein